MTGRLSMIVLALVAGGLVAGCRPKDEGAASGLKGKLAVLGSSTLVPVAEAVGEKLHAQHPEMEVTVESATDSNAFGSVRNGLAGIGLVAGGVPAEFPDLKPVKIGRDGLCLVLNKNNPVTALSDEQVLGIFTKHVQNWKDVGGEDHEIRPINASDPRSTLLMFMNYLKIERLELHGDSFQSADKHAFETISEHPEAIAYVSIGGTLTAVKKGQPLKCVGFRGGDPTPEGLAGGQYPLAYDLNLITKGDPKPAEKAFIDFALSPEGQEIIKAQSFVPL